MPLSIVDLLAIFALGLIALALVIQRNVTLNDVATALLAVAVLLL